MNRKGKGADMNTKQMIMAVLGMIFKVAVTIIVVVFVYKAALTAYDYGYRIFQEPPVSAQPGIDMQVDITVGKSPLQVGEILEAKGLIRDAKLFYIQNLLSQYKDKMQAGSYTLNTSMTMQEMMAVMSVVDEETEEPSTEGGSGGNLPEEGAGEDEQSNDEQPAETDVENDNE